MTSTDHNTLFAGHAWYAPGVKGMFGLFGWLLLGSLLGIIVELVAGLFLSEQTIQDYGSLVTYPLQFLPAMVYAAKQSRKNRPCQPGYALNSGHFGPYGMGMTVLLTVLLTFSAMFVIDLPAYWNMRLTTRSSVMAELYEEFNDMMKQMIGGPFWSSFLAVAIFAPVFEEWANRGMVLRGLLTRMKPFWAILISALFFAILHFNPWQGIEALIIGMIMGYIYFKTGSLILTMLIHFINNAFSVIGEHIDSLKDIEGDYWVEILDKSSYTILYIIAFIILSACLYAFSRIKLENPWGNIDRIPPANEVVATETAAEHIGEEIEKMVEETAGTTPTEE